MKEIRIGAIVRYLKPGEPLSENPGSLVYPDPAAHRQFLEKMNRIKFSFITDSEFSKSKVKSLVPEK